MIMKFGNAQHYVNEREVKGFYFNNRHQNGLIEAIITFRNTEKDYKFAMTDSEYNDTVRALEDFSGS